MTLTYEDLGAQPAYLLRVTQAIHQQLKRERIESEVEAFYQQLRDEAAERRANNPDAYALPPGWQPPQFLEDRCPECGALRSVR